MTFQEIYNKRKKLHDALLENESGLLELVKDLYPDITHFVYEILQNAEDAKASSIEFTLQNDKLEIRHNGIVFTIEDIDRITNVAGKQNEKKKNREKIGKFGIGFKSVYAVTTIPRIQSGLFDFEIKNYLLPTNFSDINNFRDTIITLPFNHSDRDEFTIFELIKDKFNKLEFFNLLFLNNLNTINLRVGNQLRTITKNGKESLLKGSKIAYKSVISTNDIDYEYLLFKEDVKHEAFSSLKNKPKVAIAFKQSLVDGKLHIIKGDTSKLFVFFETYYETFLKFIIHAPFATTPARDNVNFQEPINLALLYEVIDLMKKALEYLGTQKLISVDFLNQLPIDPSIDKKELVYWKFFETIKDEFLSGKKYLPANDGTLLASASTVGLIRGKELKQILASKHDLQMLFKIDYWLDPQITIDKTSELRSYLMKELSIKEYGSDDFARVVTKDFFESKQNSWVKLFYGFLNGKQQSLFTIGRNREDGVLRRKPIIRLSNGRHTEPFDLSGKPKVYLPVAKKKVPYDTIHPEVISNKPSLEFIRDKLGIKEPDLLDEIKQHIIPLYKTGVKSFPANKLHLEHVEFIFDVYEKGKDFVKSELVELIKSEGIFFFQAREFNSEKVYYVRVDNCYLRDKLLEEYFRFSEKVYFLYDELYSPGSLNLLHEIAVKCGVKKYVRRVKVNTIFSTERKRQLRLNSSYKSDEITLQHGDNTSDYSLQGFSDIFNQDIISKSDSLLIWNILLAFIKNDPNKEDLFRGIYWWFRSVDRTTYFPSQILIYLRNKQWLYNKQDIICRPNETTLSNFSEAYDITLEESRFLIDKLQFKTEAEEEYLNQIPEEKRNELLEAAELIRLSRETGIDYKTLLQQRIGEEKMAEYNAELNAAPALEDVTPIEIDFIGFDNSGIDVVMQDSGAENEPDQKPNGNEDSNNGKNGSGNQLPQEIKNKLGYRGERVVWLELKKKWKKKFELIRETETELEFRNINGENFTITHLNETGKKGIGCDILIKQGELVIKYIEVKSTKNTGKEYYSVSGYQWSLAYKSYDLGIGNNYTIYVVTNVLSDKPTITPIDNPIKKWKDGKLRANPVNIEL